MLGWHGIDFGIDGPWHRMNGRPASPSG